MKTTTLLLLGAAAVGYYLYKKGQPSLTGTATGASTVAMPTAATPVASSTPQAAATDTSQTGANAVVPAVIVVQPDDHYDVYSTVGWGPAWGALTGGGHHGGHGGHHGGHR